MATAKLLDDIMQCPICTQVYTDPRSLPCVHMYCLKCIEAWSKGKQPGDKVACPLCRKEFTVPSNGVEDLPKNFYVANFLEMKELLSVESKTSLCEVCSADEESESEVQHVASVYCFECQMKLCRKCGEQHKLIKATRSHKPVSIGQSTDADILYQSKPPARCDKHKDDILKLYCFECKSAICMMCSAISHRNHECNDIDAVTDEFRKQMAYDVNNVAAGINKCREMLDSLEKEKNEFIEQVEKTGVEVNEKAQQLKWMIDVHNEKLMNKLSSFKEKRMKEIESAREEIERELLSRESYKKYVDEVRQKGTACDIATAASSLHERAEELQKNDDAERTLADLGHVDVTFTSSDFVVDDVQKTLGHLTPGGSMNLNAFRLTHVIPSAGIARHAVASLGNEVFVPNTNSQQIEVYDANNFTLQRSLTVAGLGPNCYGLVPCISNNCLYASSNNNNTIHRVDLSGSNAVKSWSVGSNPRALSVNKAHNVVVACHGVNKVQEYTTDGSFVSEINLQPAGLTCPWHAVQLSTGDYVVSHHRSPGVISVVRVDGQVVLSYDKSHTSDVGEMKNPACLAVTNHGDILVADMSNNRILSINTSLSTIQQLALPVDDGLKSSYGLCLYESRGRLYVSETGGRVLVFECML